MPFIERELPDFRSFAGATLDEIYGRASLDAALALEADTLASGVYWNEPAADGAPRYVFEPLPPRAQLAPGQGVAALDLDADGALDLVLAQNAFHREPETGRQDRIKNHNVFPRCLLFPARSLYGGHPPPQSAKGTKSGCQYFFAPRHARHAGANNLHNLGIPQGGDE